MTDKDNEIPPPAGIKTKIFIKAGRWNGKRAYYKARDELFAGYDENLNPKFKEAKMDYEELEAKCWALEHENERLTLTLTELVTLYEGAENGMDCRDFGLFIKKTITPLVNKINARATSKTKTTPHVIMEDDEEAIG